VAPPGSGKTVLGLYLWAECIRKPALVLSPNSAIQAQWAARTDLFTMDQAGAQAVSTNPKSPGLLTSLTYQSVTLPQRGDASDDARAVDLWQQNLVEKAQALDAREANVWIADLRRNNPSYYNDRMGAYRKQLRDELSLGGQALETLHRSSLETLRRLRDHGIGLVILDECHHLMGHWGRVLADANELLDHPIVIGLTATPPDRDGRKPEDIQRYDEYFGEVDFEVPVPAVVKDGYLAPYQDLVYFVRPTADELAYVANADDQLHALVEDLCQTEPEEVEPAEIAFDDVVDDKLADSGQAPELDEVAEPVESVPDEMVETASEFHFESLPTWVARVLSEYRLPTGVRQDWASFQRRDPDFAENARLFLALRNIPLPENVPELVLDLQPEEVPEMTILIPVLDRYVRHYLRRSPREEDHRRAEKAIGRLRTLGVQITDTGSQACASPVGRVMAYSRSKTQALPTILSAEINALGEAIRAVVVTDYEKTSAVTAAVEHLLDDEAGGAVAAFKSLLSSPTTDNLDPILLTGSSVLVDDDLADAFVAAADKWLRERGHKVELILGEEDGFRVIHGKGGDWCPRVYIELITEQFQRGLTKCLVGTRGLLGEGWDANKINVLIDLTTVTTSMTVNQLRGRSIRLDADDPMKLANNWDVVCIAPEFSKGLDDYRRFIAKHKTIYGVTDDAAIEKGVGHVHAALTELKPEGLEGSVRVLNDEMLNRVGSRAEVRQKWRIGEPYHDRPVRALETRNAAVGGGFPPFAGSRDPWNATSLATAIGTAVLHALTDAKLIRRKLPLHVGTRAGGYVRLFLENAEEDENVIFTTSMHEALGPLHRPRYVIPRYVHNIRDTWISSFLPEIIGKYFRRREQQRVMLHAVPAMLARNKKIVAIYENHWNLHVSVGEAVYAHRGEGERLVAEATRAKQVPSSEIREKEIFM
jgi:superfamily II DNA or RNA helicase